MTIRMDTSQGGRPPTVSDFALLEAASWGGPEVFREATRVTEILTEVRVMAILISREVFQYVINYNHTNSPGKRQLKLLLEPLNLGLINYRVGDLERTLEHI